MLTVILGRDWTINRRAILEQIAEDVANQRHGRILIVPELISHETERQLSFCAGDTASRYAEVLPFTRLYRRVCEVLGIGTQECLDNGGRVIAMAAAARQLHGHLKSYASVESKPEFLTGLVDVVDEFKRCCISADDLMRASKQTDGVLAQKLEELSLLLHAYDALCANGKKDSADQMTWLLDALESSSYAKEHTFYIDGFPDYTTQHMAIIEHLICNSPDVVISFNTDSLDSENHAFEKAGETAGKIVRFAKRNNIPYRICKLTERDDKLKIVRKNLFQGAIDDISDTCEVLHVQQFKSVYEECLACAEMVQKLVFSGCRYRDISIVCSDISSYQNTLQLVLDRCRIPLYLSGTESILDKPVIITVLAALEAALNGFDQADVLRYAKSMLSPVSLEMSDLLENYVILWNIHGSRWFSDWTFHPDGLDAEWTTDSEDLLSLLNQARRQIVDPLQKLYNAFRVSSRMSDHILSLYQFFVDIALAQRLQKLAEDFDVSGDPRNGQIMNQLWDILLSAMEQMYDILGDTSWDQETFGRLFRLLLSQYDVGTIPPVLDSVMAGPVSAMRCQQVKHVIVLGALEGQLPGYTGMSGVLSEQERTAIRQLGVPLTGGAIDGVQAEFAEIYGVFCGAEQSISVFCPAGQPSYLFRRLLMLRGSSSNITTEYTVARADTVEAAAYLSSINASNTATSLNLKREYETAQAYMNYKLGKVDNDQITALYGRSLYLSASQVDKLADCRFSYFLKYGLRLKERKEISIDPAEFGTFVHSVLESTAKEVMERGGFHRISLVETLEISDKHAKAYVENRFHQLDSSRISYLLQRNAAELKLVVQDLWEELSNSEFEPIGFEVAFGDHAELAAIPISGHHMSARLRGFVDRVDLWEDANQRFYRVVDYKTGRKDFDYCDVFSGYGLQMLLYLFALEDSGESLLGEHAIASGVQYFPARVPVVSSDGTMTDEESALAREKSMKRKGLLLQDERILQAMEPGEKPKRMNYTRKKDGSISGDLATTSQMHMLKAYVFTLLVKMVDDIASGCVEANPYTRGSSHNACHYCPFHTICHSQYVEGRRNYRTMSTQRFWEEIEKEMGNHG